MHAKFYGPTEHDKPKRFFTEPDNLLQTIKSLNSAKKVIKCKFSYFEYCRKISKRVQLITIKISNPTREII